MSKKDRLKKQSLAQLERKKALENEEREEKAKASESKTAKKYRKRARRGGNALMTIIKVLMIIPYLWSGFCYGGIFIFGITMEQMDDVPGRIAVFIGIGSLLCLTGMVFAFLGRYKTQFAIIMSGTVLFMYGASYIVGKAQERIRSGVGLTEEQRNLASKWRFGLYPIMLLAALSAALLAIYIIRKALTRRRQRREYDNRPVKSIIE